MKYKKPLIIGTSIAISGVTGVSLAATHSNPPLPTATHAAVQSVTTPTVTETAPVADTTPQTQTQATTTPTATPATTTQTVPQTLYSVDNNSYPGSGRVQLPSWTLSTPWTLSYTTTCTDPTMGVNFVMKLASGSQTFGHNYGKDSGSLGPFSPNTVQIMVAVPDNCTWNLQIASAN